MKGLFIGIFTALLTSNAFCYCQPNQSCWPTHEDWNSLKKEVNNHLIKPTNPLDECKKDSNSDACKSILSSMHNPFYIESQAGATQTQGWLGAWENHVSEYALEARSAEEIAAAVNFARKHHIRLVIKGTGHDYLGRSNAADSLLIFTHHMRYVKTHPSFIPTGCKTEEKGIPAITVSAGTRWLEAYNETTTKHHRYVQGGGCTTVGAAGGFTQGGGFGSFSKKFGTGSAGILEAEVVMANGEILTANRCQHPDLFWAIKGGGAGTFGVVTKLTLQTHELPEHFGILKGTLTAKNDKAYKKLIRHFLVFFKDKLNNENWGEQISFNAKNKVDIMMLFQGLNKNEAEKIWEPLHSWIKENANSYSIQTETIMIPPKHMWDYNYWQKHHPEFVTANTDKNARKGEYWWTPNSAEVSMYRYTYQSWWLPLSLFKKDKIDHLTETFYQASRLFPVTLHANKGLAGASQDAINRGRETSTHPGVYEAVGLIIMTTGSNQVYPGVKNQEPDIKAAKKIAQKISQATQLFIRAAPNAGTYANEADYFQKDWQKAFFGDHYKQLLKVKHKYDPDSVFYCHHCVGSE